MTTSVPVTTGTTGLGMTGACCSFFAGEECNVTCSQQPSEAACSTHLGVASGDWFWHGLGTQCNQVPCWLACCLDFGLPPPFDTFICQNISSCGECLSIPGAFSAFVHYQSGDYNVSAAGCLHPNVNCDLPPTTGTTTGALMTTGTTTGVPPITTGTTGPITSRCCRWCRVDLFEIVRVQPCAPNIDENACFAWQEQNSCENGEIAEASWSMNPICVCDFKPCCIWCDCELEPFIRDAEVCHRTSLDRCEEERNQKNCSVSLPDFCSPRMVFSGAACELGPCTSAPPDPTTSGTTSQIITTGISTTTGLTTGIIVDLCSPLCLNVTGIIQNGTGFAGLHIETGCGINKVLVDSPLNLITNDTCNKFMKDIVVPPGCVKSSGFDVCNRNLFGNISNPLKFPTFQCTNAFSVHLKNAALIESGFVGVITDQVCVQCPVSAGLICPEILTSGLALPVPANTNNNNNGSNETLWVVIVILAAIVLCLIAAGILVGVVSSKRGRPAAAAAARSRPSSSVSRARSRLREEQPLVG